MRDQQQLLALQERDLASENRRRDLGGAQPLRTRLALAVAARDKECAIPAALGDIGCAAVADAHGTGVLACELDHVRVAGADAKCADAKVQLAQAFGDHALAGGRVVEALCHPLIGVAPGFERLCGTDDRGEAQRRRGGLLLAVGALRAPAEAPCAGRLHAAHADHEDVRAAETAALAEEVVPDRLEGIVMLAHGCITIICGLRVVDRRLVLVHRLDDVAAGDRADLVRELELDEAEARGHLFGSLPEALVISRLASARL
jgi:hypothetical protein